MKAESILLRDFVFRLKKSGHKCTLLCVGPVSRNVIKATFEACMHNFCPPIFIASRNQVDLKRLGHGYLMGGMDQRKFVKTLDQIKKDVGYKGPMYICRDHGGPWQRNIELNQKYSVKHAMKIAKTSFKADIEAGFNYIHIDPTKCPHSLTFDDLCNWTVELVEYCEKVRKDVDGGPIDYEVGTEDIKGGLTTKECLGIFLAELTRILSKKGLPIPTCVVGQTGSLTCIDCNMGHFDRKGTRNLAATADKYGIGFKEHNGDYLSAATCRIHPDIGITGMNVAPEFGLVETDAYMELANLESKLVREGWLKDKDSSHLHNLFVEKTFKCSPWKKWMTNEIKKLPERKIKSDKCLRLLIARVCGHYVYDEPEIKRAINKLFCNINRFSLVEDSERFVIKNIRNSIEFYIRHFRMKGINRKV